jgi:probable rRNA maturation factor
MCAKQFLKNKYKIELFDEQSDVNIVGHLFIKLACLTLEHEKVPSGAEMSINFVDQSKITELNRRYRKISKPTDVLSFPVDDPRDYSGRIPDNSFPSPTRDFPNEEPPVLLGDVFISPAIANINAQHKNLSLERELYLLTVHGILHLLGFDHEKSVDFDVMSSHEQIILNYFTKKFLDKI